MYWLTLVVVLALKPAAAAIIVHGWLPAVPRWLLVLLFMAVFPGMVGVVAVRVGPGEVRHVGPPGAPGSAERDGSVSDPVGTTSRGAVCCLGGSDRAERHLD